MARIDGPIKGRSWMRNFAPNGRPARENHPPLWLPSALAGHAGELGEQAKRGGIGRWLGVILHGRLLTKRPASSVRFEK